MDNSDTFTKEAHPAYERDDGPLSPEALDFIRAVARSMLPKGKVLNTRSLLEKHASLDEPT